MPLALPVFGRDCAVEGIFIPLRNSGNSDSCSKRGNGEPARFCKMTAATDRKRPSKKQADSNRGGKGVRTIYHSFLPFLDGREAGLSGLVLVVCTTDRSMSVRHKACPLHCCGARLPLLACPVVAPALNTPHRPQPTTLATNDRAAWSPWE